METTRKRIRFFIENQGIKPKNFLEKTNQKKGILDNSVSNHGVTDNVISNILENYPEISPDWLLTGKGEMLRKTDNRQSVKIPLYDGVVVGGSQSVADLSPQTQAIEHIDAGDWFRDASAAMRVHGDSMDPLYKSGSIIVIREVQDKTLVVFGQDYLIETTEYRVVKRIQKSEQKQCWLLCSVNQECYESTGRLIHEPFDVYVDHIKRLHRVLGCVTRTESSNLHYV